MGWNGWEDLTSLGERARRQILDRLEADAARDRARGLPADRTRTEQLVALRVSLRPARQAAAAPTGGGRREVRVPRRRHDIGDLGEPSTYAAQYPARIVVQLLDVVELVNATAGTHWGTIHRVEARWKVLAMNTALAAALEPVDACTVTVWHLVDRRRHSPSAALPDSGAAHHAVKGAVDGLVAAGVLPDDGPGYLRATTMVEAVLSNADGLVLELTETRTLPPFPVLTVPAWS